MTVNDPISDMLTRIRNGIMADHKAVSMPSSKLKAAIAQILKEEGYIEGFEVVDGEKPHEKSDVVIAKNAVNVMAPRGEAGTFASIVMRRLHGFDAATTNPPMMISTICIVNGISTQKPRPNSSASVSGASPTASPATNTIATIASAKTNASGKYFSVRSAIRPPKRASNGWRLIRSGALTYPAPRDRRRRGGLRAPACRTFDSLALLDQTNIGPVRVWKPSQSLP